MTQNLKTQFNATVNIKDDTQKKYNDKLLILDELGIDYKNIINFDDFYNQMVNIKVRSRNKKTTNPIDTIISRSTLITYLSAVSNYYKLLNDKTEYVIDTLNSISNKLKILSNQKQSIIKTGTLIGNQQRNFVSWEIVAKAYKMLENARNISQNHFLKFLVLSLYYLTPPRRRRDYYMMHITNDENNLSQSLNYYVRCDKPCFYFNQYKTQTTYKTQKIYIKKELANIINAYIDEFNISGSLLNCSGDRIYSIFKSIFKKNVSVNILRHSYISEMESKGVLINNKNRVAISGLMAHSIKTQIDYIKYPDKPFIDNNNVEHLYGDINNIINGVYELDVNDIVI